MYVRDRTLHWLRALARRPADSDGRAVGRDAADTVAFRCNICAAACRVAPASLSRETPSCAKCGSTVRMRAIVHLLTTDRAVTTRVINKVGYKVARETEVIVERIEDRPGMLGKVTRQLADAGINLLAIHKSDPVANELQVPEVPAQSSAA